MNRLYETLKALIDSKTPSFMGLSVADAKKASKSKRLFSWIYTEVARNGDIL
jgi:hypothetical protein